MTYSKIEWTDMTWNPVRGCSRVSPGCVNCYAERIAARFSGAVEDPHEVDGELFLHRPQPFFGFAEMTDSGPRWTGRVALDEQKLLEPLRWRNPRRVFVNSMSDLFHEKLNDHDIIRVFAVMAMTPHITYQILTKRAERMRAWMRAGCQAAWLECLSRTAESMNLPRGARHSGGPAEWPLPHVWMGVSCETQKHFEERSLLLRETPAAVRFVSLEPLLEPINLVNRRIAPLRGERLRDWLHLVIVGGESGPGARPCDVRWVDDIASESRVRGLAVFVKQDSGPRPGLQGRIPSKLWSVKEFPCGS